MSDETKLDLYWTPKSAWDAMYEDCANSKKSIDFEQYILKDDSAGLRFLELFRDKAKQGIKVRLILDSIGSRTLISSLILKEFIDAGGHVHFYNRIVIGNLLSPHKWFPRNHTKLIVIDHEIAYVGSVCVSEEMADWRDLHARITGELVSKVQTYFNHVWSHRYKSWRRSFSRKVSRLHEYQKDFSFLAALARFHPNFIYCQLLNEIRRAEKSVYLITPYFMPPLLLARALRSAAKRGVDVKVMMSLKSDVPIADYVSQSYFKKATRIGVKILLYPNTVVHAKYAIIDGKWATLGSTNMDYLSLRRNREANIVIRHQETINTLLAQFNKDLAECITVDDDYCEKLPIYNKVVGRLGRIFKQFL